MHTTDLGGSRGSSAVPVIRMLIWIAAVVVSLLFLLLTARSVTDRGFLEVARCDAPHFEAGAGDDLVLVRGGLAVLATLLGLAAAFFARNWRARVAIALTALVALPLFFWSCLGIERWAPGYSEQAFDAIYNRYSRHERVSAAEVTSALGAPLYTCPSASGESEWLYSYMPSGGFGWNKRILWVRDNVLTYMYSLDEP